MVTVGAYAGPSGSTTLYQTINFKPLANATTGIVAENTAQQIQLNGQNTFPDSAVTVPLTYALLSQPAHGTVSNFNASTGTLPIHRIVVFSERIHSPITSPRPGRTRRPQPRPATRAR